MERLGDAVHAGYHDVYHRDVVGGFVKGVKDLVSLAYGWEEESNENVLTELDAKDPVTGYCEFRNLACRIRKATGWS